VQGLVSIVPYVICGIALAALAALVVYVAGWWLTALVRRHLPSSTFRLMVSLGVIAFFVHWGGGKTNGNNRASVPCYTAEETPALSANGHSENGFVTNGLSFSSISVDTNQHVHLELTWPANICVAGDILDLFVKPRSLATEDWQWEAEHRIGEAETNWCVSVAISDFATGGTNPPSLFFKSVLRQPPEDMRDTDNDGLPDVYEFHNGTNPFLSDYVAAPKLTVGASADFQSLEAAFAASTNYSIIELATETFELDDTLVLPSHPVMVTGLPNGYTILRSSAEIGVMLLDAGQGYETYFSNLQLVLTARSGFQAGFWIGGNLPWSGPGASPTFRNVRVRALYPGVLHYGWHYYRDDGGRSAISNCVLNAAGSSSAIGVYAYNGPCVDVTDCAFVNIPTNESSCAIYIKTGTNEYVTVASTYPDRSWAGYPLDAVYGSDIDSDGDGLSDYDEIHVYDTDPWLADSDGDGISDAEELDDGTDPRSVYSFHQSVTVAVSASDELPDVTTYIAWGLSENGWETNGVSECTCLPATNVFVRPYSPTPVYVKAFRDLNRNGSFDPDVDILLIQEVPLLEAFPVLSFRFGDVDGDGISDAQERVDGTDPMDPSNKAYHLVQTCTHVFQTTNALTFQVILGTNTVLYGPSLVTNRVWTHDFGLVVITNNEQISLLIWDDANSNQVCDTWETCNQLKLVPHAHEANLTNRLVYGNFDLDKDGLPDWWELCEGLSMNGSPADEYADPDGDGLINLHEFWAGTDPLTADGSNTLLSVCARSVDDRIKSINVSNSLGCFINYFENASNQFFVANTNYWLYDVDISCVNVARFDTDCDGIGAKPATAITRRHVVMAHHWHGNNYVFCDTNGLVVSRQIVSSVCFNVDLLLGRLNEPLPMSFKPAKVFSGNINDFLGSGRRLPSVCINQDKKATILEMDELLCESYGDSDYGSVLRDNAFSEERCSVRAATYDGYSGCPVFLLAGNDLVLLFAKHRGWPGAENFFPAWGPLVSAQLSQIQNQIDIWEGDAASDYQLDVFDFSPYDNLTGNE